MKKEPSLTTAEILGLGMSAVGLLLTWMSISKNAQLSAARDDANTKALQTHVTGQVTPLPPKKRLLSPGDAWALYGDSLVGGGVGSNNPGGLVPPLTKLSADYGAPFHAYGKKSSTINEWAGTITKAMPVVDFEYRVIVIELGTNDAWFPNPADQRKAIHDLVTTFRQKGAEIVWIVPPAINGSTSVEAPRRAELLAQLTEAAEKDQFVLWNPGDVPLVQETRPVHPTGAGYDLMAKNLFAFLTQGNA